MSTVCEPWIAGVDVAECCAVECDDPSQFNSAAQTASDLLFQFSGRQFPGICEQTVRPCSNWCRCPWQVLSRGYVIWNPYIYDPTWGYGYGWWNCNGDNCGCTPISRTLLAGYVQEVSEVLIDGVVVNPDTYRVDRHRWLTRIRQTPDDDWPHWPGCQDLTLPDDQAGTWSVTYTYGVEPPSAGVNAATELACEIFKACAGQDCKLPKGVVRLARQGVVIEKTPFAAWGFESGKRGRLQKGWQTGMASVDAFLNGYNQAGLIAQPIFWSPARAGRYPLPS